MNEKHLDPAKSVIAKLGGVEAVANVTGKHVSRIYRWMYPKDRGGTGGFIPQSDYGALLSYARASGIELSPSEFVEPLPAVVGGQS
ncbi:MAG: hypothetical protein H6883_07075 [Rhodobiaceae bacterium]|nr:hypothetical protein [Rhodobiaceae bacterium]MCC0055882.1 hypothetical protein [Rhodobiaceae bacterium]